VPMMPDYLKMKGFRTAAISSMGNVSPHFGFGRGFDEFVELYKEEKVIRKWERNKRKDFRWKPYWQTTSEEVAIPTSEDINDYLLPLVKESRGKDVFVFVWSIDTHGPYFHRDPRRAKFSDLDEIWVRKKVDRMQSESEIRQVTSLYEDMIYYNDHHLGVLLKELRERGLYEETFLILTSDHGEAFGEHGFNGHGREPYDELIRVPLIMKFPHSEFKGEVSGLVQHIDVVPTILDYVGGGNDVTMFQGRSLLPLLRDGVKVNEFVFSEYQIDEKLPRHVVYRTDTYKYMEARPGRFAIQRSLFRTLSPLYRSIVRQRCLYNVKEDPGERVNVIKGERERARDFGVQVRSILRRNEELSRRLGREKKEKASMDPEVAKQLKALGYFD